MPNSTLKNASYITAYTIASGLAFFGVAWFLVQFGTQIQRGTRMPFSTHLTGYTLAVLFAAGGALMCLVLLRRMPVVTARKVRRITAYIFGSVLICLGVMGFLIELGKGMPSSRHFAGYVLAVVLVVCGVLTCIAVRLQYGGGLWSLLGLLLVAAGSARLAFGLQLVLQGGYAHSAVVFGSTTATLLGVGIYCLSWGHLRRDPSKKSSLNDPG